MMLAYRRGLLEPDYKYGRQSVLRERMILEMLSMEQNAEALKNAVTLKCISLAPALDPSKAVEYTNSLMPAMTKVAYLSEYDPADVTSEEDILASGAKKLEKAFNMLSDRGIIEEFKRTAAAAVEAHLQQSEDQ